MEPRVAERTGAGVWLTASALIALGAGMLIPSLADIVVVAGRNLGQPELVRDYVRGAGVALLLGCSILLWPVPLVDRSALLVIWAAKAALALGPMLFYEQYYDASLDAYFYYRTAASGEAALFSPSLFNSLDNIILLVHFISGLVGYSYHATKIVFGFIGLVSVYLFYRASVLLTGRRDARVLFALALLPSVLFWSATLGKDSVALLGMSLYAWGVCGWQRKAQQRFLVPIASGILISSAIRLWYAPLLMVPVVWLALRMRVAPLTKVVVLGATVAASVVAISLFGEKFKITTGLDMFTATTSISQSFADGGSGRAIPEFDNITSIVTFLPIGMFTALFRPLPGEVMNPFGLMAGMENMLILILLGVAAVRMRRETLRDPLVQAALLLIVCWSVLYSVVSYGNLGTAVRYRLQILPILFGVLLYLARQGGREPVDPR
jgi:hypothetical protein